MDSRSPRRSGLIHTSSKTRNWSKAERLARELERRAEFPRVIEVKESVRAIWPIKLLANSYRRH